MDTDNLTAVPTRGNLEPAERNEGTGEPLQRNKAMAKETKAVKTTLGEKSPIILF